MSLPSRRLLGEVLLAMGRPDLLGEAQGHFEQAMTELEQHRADPELALAYAGTAFFFGDSTGLMTRTNT